MSSRRVVMQQQKAPRKQEAPAPEAPAKVSLSDRFSSMASSDKHKQLRPGTVSVLVASDRFDQASPSRQKSRAEIIARKRQQGTDVPAPRAAADASIPKGRTPIRVSIQGSSRGGRPIKANSARGGRGGKRGGRGGRGGDRPTRGGRGGARGGRGKPVTKESLDGALDAYMADADPNHKQKELDAQLAAYNATAPAASMQQAYL